MSPKPLFAAVLMSGLLSVSLQASPILGTFNIAGTIAVTNTTIVWTLNNSPFTPEKAQINAGGTGSFTVTDGTLATILDLNSGLEPVGVAFAQQPFISFDSLPLFPTLNINFIYGGIYSSAACGLPPAVGQTCSISPTSPFNFANNPPAPPAGPQATGTWVFSGVTSDGLENWQGNFTSQFTIPYQDILATLAANGTVVNTFSASFVLTDSAIPEPATMSLIGLGLLAGALKLRRRKSSPLV